MIQEQKKLQKTAKAINLPLVQNDAKTPEMMMQVIATSLGMQMQHYKKRSRKREMVELRFVTAMLMRSHFPYTTLQQIARLFGGQDHTSVINGLARAYELIYIGDLSFTRKYNLASQAVNGWLQKMSSIAA